MFAHACIDVCRFTCMHMFAWMHVYAHVCTCLHMFAPFTYVTHRLHFYMFCTFLDIVHMLHTFANVFHMFAHF